MEPFECFIHTFCDDRHDDLREMLDNSKDGPKLDAMRRIIGVILLNLN